MDDINEPRRRISSLLPASRRQLADLGERLRTARLRRELSMVQVAERADIGRETLGRLEAGDAGSSLGVLVRVLKVLGLESDLASLALDDALGRKLQDLRLPTRKRRAPKQATPGQTDTDKAPNDG